MGSDYFMAELSTTGCQFCNAAALQRFSYVLYLVSSIVMLELQTVQQALSLFSVGFADVCLYCPYVLSCASSIPASCCLWILACPGESCRAHCVLQWYLCSQSGTSYLHHACMLMFALEGVTHIADLAFTRSVIVACMAHFVECYASRKPSGQIPQLMSVWATQLAISMAFDQHADDTQTEN